VIDDRRQVASQIIELRRRLDALAEWTTTPEAPFPADQVELGEFVGRVAVLLLSGGPAPGDGPAGAERLR
jgi:hypothetical protein